MKKQIQKLSQEALAWASHLPKSSHFGQKRKKPFCEGSGAPGFGTGYAAGPDGDPENERRDLRLSAKGG